MIFLFLRAVKEKYGAVNALEQEFHCLSCTAKAPCPCNAVTHQNLIAQVG